jgi:hypothetical protein
MLTPVDKIDIAERNSSKVKYLDFISELQWYDSLRLLVSKEYEVTNIRVKLRRSK